jgi:hypothetical protein
MPDVGTGITTGLSLFSASEGQKASESAGDMQAAQLQLEIERDAFNREQIEQQNEWTREDRGDFLQRRDRTRGLLDPVQEGIVGLAMQGPDYEGATSRSDADVSQAYGMQREQEQRRRQRYGINPASGVETSENRRFGNSEALARVGGRNRARMQEDDRDWARKIAAYGTGNNQNSQPSSTLQQLGVSGAGGVYGQMAGNEMQNASGAYQFAGSMFADAMDRWGAPQSPTPSDSNGSFSATRTGGEDNYFDY